VQRTHSSDKIKDVDVHVVQLMSELHSVQTAAAVCAELRCTETSCAEMRPAHYTVTVHRNVSYYVTYTIPVQC